MVNRVAPTLRLFYELNTLPGGNKLSLIKLGIAPFWLGWDDPSGEMYWEEESAFSSEDSINFEMFACNTRKVLIYFLLTLYLIYVFKRTKIKGFADILLVYFLGVGHVA